jgi:hypothetical protein
MSREEDQWAEDKANGTLDDPIYPNWKVPNCSCCDNRAYLAVMPKTYSMGSLTFPPYDNAIFYCYNHMPIKYKS